MKDKLIKNIFSQVICHILQFSASVILVILVGKFLGPEGLGRFSFVTTFAVMFVFLCDWGLSILIIREIARKKDELNKYINNTVGLGIAFSIATLVFLAIILHFLRYPFLLTFQIYLGILWIILGVFISFFRAAFHAFEKMKYEAVALLVEKPLLIITASLALFFWKSISLLLVLMIFFRVVNLLVSIMIYNNNFGTLRFEFNRKLWVELTKAAFPFGLNILFSNIYLCSDVVLLGFIRGEAETGLYRAATAIVLPLGMVSLSINNSLFPFFSKSHFISKNSLYLGLSKTFKYLFGAGLFLTILIFMFSSEIINIFYSDAFSRSILSLEILSFLVPLRFLNNSLSVALTASNLQKQRTLSIGIGAMSNLLMNLFIIQRLGYIGASITTIITDLIIFVLLLYFVFKYIFVFSVPKMIYKSVISAIIVIFFIVILKSFVPFYVNMALALIMYFGILFLCDGYKRKDLSDFINLVSITD